MAFERYGLTLRGDDSGKPLQYVVDDAGNWTMNCFSCHGGSVYGVPAPGAPNNRFALQTLTEEIDHERIGFQIEIATKVPLSEPDVAIRRSYFDTRRFGKSNTGHVFPDQLSEEQKLAVLEYLKTL